MTSQKERNRWGEKKKNPAKSPYLTQLGHNELECRTTDTKQISFTLALIILTYLPTSSNYFRSSYIKFPKSGLGVIQKLCSSPFCLKIYKSFLSGKVQLKCHLLQKVPSHLPTACSLHSPFLKIIYLYLFWEIIISTSPPEFITSAHSQNWSPETPSEILPKCFFFLTLTRENVQSIRLINTDIYTFLKIMEGDWYNI